MAESRSTALVVALAIAMPLPAIAEGDQQQAQIDKGRAVVAQACTTCHTTLGRMLQVHTQTPGQWKDTVYFMIGRGAQVMPDEIEAVAAFLASTAGRGRPAAQRSNQQTDAEGGVREREK